MGLLGKQFWWPAAAILGVAALAAADPNMPPPGTLNYVEGQVYVQNQEQID